jgi:hypothetical protein
MDLRLGLLLSNSSAFVFVKMEIIIAPILLESLESLYSDSNSNQVVFFCVILSCASSRLVSSRLELFRLVLSVL